MMVRKRNILAAAAFFTIVVLVALIVVGNMIAIRSDDSKVEAVPEIADIGPSHVRISWHTDKRISGRVFYRTAGSEKPPHSVRETLGPSFEHEVVIDGLEGGKRYLYWLEGSEVRYLFRTPPPLTIPFSFLVTWGDVSSQVPSLLANEDPDFILSLTPRYSADRDLFAEAKPHLPIFEFEGPREPEKGREHIHGKEWATWALEWGGLRLVLFDGRTGMPESLKTSTAHTLGIVCAADALPGGAVDEESAAAMIRSSSLHANLVAYNEEFPSHPAAFVVVVRGDFPAVAVDEINYLSVLTDEQPASGAVRVDVAMGSTVGVFVDEGREVVLRRSAIRERRTCEECRQLADQGAYEESVAAYREFIMTHEGHYQIDDAYLAIAEILDENLFRYTEALEWYQGLLENYPRSSLVPLARQRLRYLTEHSDYDFEPLARFERIRKVEFARKRNSPDQLQKLLADVRKIVNEFPECSLAPDMIYWLANQFRRSDVDRAVATYREFIEEYPDHPDAEIARLEIGKTYYDARRYHDAIRAYEEVMRAVPDKAGAAEVQIARAERNLRRRSLAWSGYIVLFLIAALGAVWPPAGFSPRKFTSAVLAWMILTFLIAAAGWLIHEQFSSTRQIMSLAVAFAAAASLGYPFTSALAEKLFRVRSGKGSDGRRVVCDIFATVLGVVFFTAGSYVTIYHVNEHYLILVGL